MESLQIENVKDYTTALESKYHKLKVFAVVMIAVVVVLSIVLAVAVLPIEDSDEDKLKEENKQIKTAIEMIEESWRDTYESMPATESIEREHIIEILHTRVINIKDNDVERFENIDFVVEFVLYTDFYGSSPYYVTVPTRPSAVIFYKDGTKEVCEGNIITSYIATTGDYTLAEILESVEDYGTEYNQVIKMK